MQGCTEDRTPSGHQKDEEEGVLAKRVENRAERLRSRELIKIINKTRVSEWREP